MEATSHVCYASLTCDRLLRTELANELDRLNLRVIKRHTRFDVQVLIEVLRDDVEFIDHVLEFDVLFDDLLLSLELLVNVG